MSTPYADAPTPTPYDVAETTALAGRVLDEVERAVVGKRQPLTLVLAAVLAGGHALLEDYPGLGKTLAARSLATTLGLGFTRAQFTPDLLPGDLTGSFVYDQRTSDFAFRPGPVFTGLLLADEINRTPPKTQSALLEAMQERQVTVEGRTFALPRPFHVLATANPVEYEGTYPLPEAQLDRFLLRVSFGYPTEVEELDVLRGRMARRREEVELEPVTDAGRAARRCRPPSRRSRSTTASRGTASRSPARAAPTRRRSWAPRRAGRSPCCSRPGRTPSCRGRDYVTPEDVKAVAPAALAHRITVRPELWMSNVSGASVVRSLLSTVSAPAAVEQRR